MWFFQSQQSKPKPAVPSREEREPRELEIRHEPEPERPREPEIRSEPVAPPEVRDVSVAPGVREVPVAPREPVSVASQPEVPQPNDLDRAVEQVFEGVREF